MSVKFTVTEVSPVSSANILGTLSAGSPPTGGTSQISIVETTAAGVVLSPATYTVTVPANTFTFTAGIGSSLAATQTDVSASGISSPPNVNPPFTVVNPAPPQPGPIEFTVTGINP
jgi:hypothetical protein